MLFVGGTSEFDVGVQVVEYARQVVVAEGARDDRPVSSKVRREDSLPQLHVCTG